MTSAHYKLVDLEHVHAGFGGVPSDHDRCIIMTSTNRGSHPLTGQSQPVQVFSGTRAECRTWLQENGQRQPGHDRRRDGSRDRRP